MGIWRNKGDKRPGVTRRVERHLGPLLAAGEDPKKELVKKVPDKPSEVGETREA